MILSDAAILKAMEIGEIIIEPFDRAALGCNSYDVHLSPHLARYIHEPLDAKKDNPVEHFTIPEEGFILEPGTLYLGSTVEYTESHNHVPFLEGKSSIGRLGIWIHFTAGRGDVGFKNNWTLELGCMHPVRIYPHMPIGQLIYFMLEGDVMVPYNQKQSAKYTAVDTKPQASQMWKNRF